MKLIVTISGPHGAGKSTYARALSEALGLRHVSAGQLFRDIAKEKNLSLDRLTKLAAEDPAIDKLIDGRTREEAEKGDVVIEGQLAGWMAGDKADVKIFLTAPEKIRMERIAKRDGTRLEEARDQTLSRERMQRRRYKDYYNVDMDDLSVYDAIIDTSLLQIEETIGIMKDMVERFSKAPHKVGRS